MSTMAITFVSLKKCLYINPNLVHETYTLERTECNKRRDHVFPKSWNRTETKEGEEESRRTKEQTSTSKR